MPPPGPPPHEVLDKLKEPKPENLKEVPGYLRRLFSKFFSRLIYIFKLVWETGRWIMFAMLIISVLQGIMPVLQSYAGSFLLNALAEGYSASVSQTAVSADLWKKILLLLIIQFGCIFVSSIIGSVNGYVTKIAGEYVSNHVTVKIMEKAKEIDMAYYDNPDFYSKLENATREASFRPIQIINNIFDVISTSITLVSYFIILVNVKPHWASLLVVLLSIPGAVVSFVFRKKNVMYMHFRSKDRRQMSYYSETVTDKDVAKEMRMFNLYDTFTERYKTVFRHYFAGIKALQIKEKSIDLIFTLVSAIANCVLFAIIAKQVFSGEMKIGNYSLYTGALNFISTGVASVIASVSSIYEGTLFIDNLISFIKIKPKITPSIENPIKPQRHTGHKIELKNVSFRYPGCERYVIHNISAVIEPGDTLVLVGLNGAGKTTLIKLITRLYDPTEGQILLDGRDIKEYDTSELYKIFGIIFQDFGKYAVSVKENITFSQIDKEADMAEIYEAAKASSSADFIERLPKKYDTPLMRYFESEGIELSIGQWQKLSIARAFYSDSDIIILDEPTASLDAIAEQEIYNQFDNLRKDKTTIFVSHRLSSATVANKIFVLENGELIEEGNHRELMEKKGKYYDLFSTQAKRYISDEKERINGMNNGRPPMMPTFGENGFMPPPNGNGPMMPPPNGNGPMMPPHPEGNGHMMPPPQNSEMPMRSPQGEGRTGI